MDEVTHEAAVRLYRDSLRAARRGTLRGPEEITALGTLIDVAGDMGREFGLRWATEWTERILARGDIGAAHRAIVHYFASNAWSALRSIRRPDEARIGWEQPESEREIAHLRYALSLDALDGIRQCQVLTNLGNALKARGRVVEAIAEYDAALRVDPAFVMAHGNRGAGLWWYANVCYDVGHRTHLVRAAHAALECALTSDDPNIHPEARCGFADLKKRIEEAVPALVLASQASSEFRRALDATELAYRTWCARQRLFLNDLNDLGESPIAMADVLTLPSFVTDLDEGPSLIGFLNQLKQEYVAARWLMYNGTHQTDVHFADRDVTLVNTLDYPAYSIGTEQVKMAFRSAYSLFDKVAFFLNDYLRLDIPERDIAFRKLWYDKGKPERGIRADLQARRNVFLQALFWLSKDFFEQTMPLVDEVEPNARRNAAIRNELEHKYLKLHEMMVGLAEGRNREPAHDRDRLAYSMSRRDFETETLAMLRKARAALMYLAFAVRLEEKRRAHERGPDHHVMNVESDVWDDEWKQ